MRRKVDLESGTYLLTCRKPAQYQPEERMAGNIISKSSNDKSTAELELTMHQAVEILSREERFMATVAAVNTLLISKGIYTQAEFDEIFCRWAKAQLLRPKSQRVGNLV